jgi:Na+/H+ antiporter NhaC
MKSKGLQFFLLLLLLSVFGFLLESLSPDRSESITLSSEVLFEVAYSREKVEDKTSFRFSTETLKNLSRPSSEASEQALILEETEKGKKRLLALRDQEEIHFYQETLYFSKAPDAFFTFLGITPEKLKDLKIEVETPQEVWKVQKPSDSAYTYLVTLKDQQLQILREGVRYRALIPPLLAIGLALITKEVLTSLFLGLYVGLILLLTPQISSSPAALEGLQTLGKAFTQSLDVYITNALYHKDHLSIILFSLLIGGMVGVITASGGLQGIIFHLSKVAKNSVLGQLATFFMGILIFFDDYANALIVGNTTRPLTDKLRISREKLSFIIDSTSAPVASLAVLSTWIGTEIGYIGEEFKKLNITSVEPLQAFWYSLPYRFYAIFLLFFIVLVAVLRRDFGPMYHAEIRAREKNEPLKKGSTVQTQDFSSVPASSIRWYNAVLPIVVLVFGVIFCIYQWNDSYLALRWSSLLASLFAIFLVASQRILSFKDTIEAWVRGASTIFYALMILTLAWSLGSLLEDIKTKEEIAKLVSTDILSETYRTHLIYLLPTFIFILSSFISFATGTSWGTMGLLFPLAIPLTVTLAGTELAEAQLLPHLYMCIGAILTGSIFGDHCSPISDTTVLSSMASGIDHMDHVNTQLPYALVVGFISIFCGYLPAGYSWPMNATWSPYLCTAFALLVMTGVLLLFGKTVPSFTLNDLADSQKPSYAPIAPNSRASSGI